MLDHNKKQMSLISKMLRCQTLQEITDQICQLVENPVVLADLTHKVLAISDTGTVNDPIWTDIKDRGWIPMDQAMNEQSVENYHNSQIAKRPVLDMVNPNLPVLCSAIECNKKLTGYLNVVCYNHQPEDEDYDILSFAMSVVSIYMERELGYGKSAGNTEDFFVADLLEGRITDQALISERLRYFDWHVEFPLLIVAIRSGFEFGTKTASQREFLLKEYCNKINHEFANSISLIYGEELRVMIPISGNPVTDEPLIMDLSAFLAKEGLRAGVSRPFFDFTQVSGYHLQACKAWELGMELEDNAPLYNYDNYAIYHLLEYGSKQRDLMSFCHTSIFILADYDRSHDTDLLETLHVYLNCHCNIQEAAAALFIHRNTMNYRMSKIYDLTNIDLDNTESFFHLLLSFHILEYYSLTVMKDYELQLKRNPTIKSLKKTEPKKDESHES